MKEHAKGMKDKVERFKILEDLNEKYFDKGIGVIEIDASGLLYNCNINVDTLLGTLWHSYSCKKGDKEKTFNVLLSEKHYSKLDLPNSYLDIKKIVYCEDLMINEWEQAQYTLDSSVDKIDTKNQI